MILTGSEIEKEVASQKIVIYPFDSKNIEPNSYRFHLADTLLIYDSLLVDAYQQNLEREVKRITIPEEGYVLKPKRFYLGCTQEVIGSHVHACELYARLSTSLCGIFIQTSAPLGHTGAIIAWTLEIVVVHPVRVYPFMPIGKICFWENLGETVPYIGRYRNSTTVTQSMLSRANP
jgi:dCTP deaminase